MAIICNKYFSTRQFTYSRSERCFVAEASELPGNPGRVYDDACDEGFILVSHQSGDAIVFALDRVDMNGDDIAGWNYKIVAVANPAGKWVNPSTAHTFTALIIND